ncbi:hypothetical protein V1512DRAFT_139605 [Lipomyces arxii]|uniref:uncharacterized protein n=1 Tax=Lipomyces arxii TaxID=56418 RepID=UPI0034CEFFC6
MTDASPSREPEEPPGPIDSPSLSSANTPVISSPHQLPSFPAIARVVAPSTSQFDPVSHRSPQLQAQVQGGRALDIYALASMPVAQPPLATSSYRSLQHYPYGSAPTDGLTPRMSLPPLSSFDGHPSQQHSRQVLSSLLAEDVYNGQFAQSLATLPPLQSRQYSSPTEQQEVPYVGTAHSHRPDSQSNSSLATTPLPNLPSQLSSNQYEQRHRAHLSRSASESSAVIPSSAGIARRPKPNVISACSNCKKAHLACDGKSNFYLLMTSHGFLL